MSQATERLSPPRPSRRPRDTIPRRPVHEPAPLSFGQEQIWLHSQLAPGVPLYAESLTIHRKGGLDPAAFAASFDEVVRRHEMLCTRIEWSGGQLVQVPSEGRPRLQLTDLRPLPYDVREVTALELAAKDLGRPIDLFREPGVRARLVTLSEDDHRLFLCLHHMVFDGISIYRVFLPELVALYEARVSGGRCALEDPPLQYADFAYWQRRTMDEGALEPHIDYWREQLAGAPAMIRLPADHSRPDTQSFRGGLVRFQFTGHLTAAVRTTALSESCTLFMFLLASFAVTLHRRSDQSDMVIGSVSGGRDRPELERIVGCFLRTLVLRIDLSGNPTFREILWRVREVLVEGLSHDGVPFQRLVRALTPARDLDRSPLFQVTFSIEPPMPELGPEWDLTEMDAGTQVSKFDLSIELEDHGEVIAVRAIYSVDLFEASSILQLLEDWREVLERVVSDPGQRLRALATSAETRPT